MAYVKVDNAFSKFIDPDDYADIMSKNDDAVVVLRLQLLCERFLNVFLEKSITEEQRSFFVVGKGKDAQLLKYFDEKLKVAIALGLPVELARALKKINTLRNNFAHEFDRKLEFSEIEEYFKLVDGFVLSVNGTKVMGGPVAEAKMKSDGLTIEARSSCKAGATMATYFLMTKAGVWLANALAAKGKLNV